MFFANLMLYNNNLNIQYILFYCIQGTFIKFEKLRVDIVVSTFIVGHEKAF